MKIWTVQKREIAQHVMTGGFYQPDFSKSAYMHSIPDLHKLYNIVLDTFNNVNYTNLPGVIFGFFGFANNKMFEIRNIEDFYELILSNRNVVNSLWKHYLKDNYVVLELEVDEPFLNPLNIDLNDFQFLMPPFMPMFPYSEQDADRILYNFQRGVVGPSLLPSNLMQVHIPNLKTKYVKDAYKILTFEQMEEFLKG